MCRFDAVICFVVVVFGYASAEAACPSSSLINGTTANADQVMDWLNCKASLEGATFTGEVFIDTAEGAALHVDVASGWSVFTHGDYASFLDPSNARGITMVTATNATRLYSDFFDSSSANPLQLGAVPNINAINVWPSGNVGLGIIDPANVRLSVLGAEIGNSLPANTGIVAVGNLRINDKSNIALDIGQYNPSPVAWMQVHDSTNQSTNYPLAFQVNGGGVGIGTISPGQKLDVAGTIRQSGCTTAGTLAVNGAGDIICSSDARLKNIKGRFTGGLDAIARIFPVLFTYKPTKQDPSETFVHAGFTAQEVKAVIPQASALQRNGYYSLDTTAILAASVNSIKQLKQDADARAMENAQLRAEIAEQNTEIARLVARVEVLERRKGLGTAPR